MSSRHAEAYRTTNFFSIISNNKLNEALLLHPRHNSKWMPLFVVILTFPPRFSEIEKQILHGLPS